MSWTPLHLHSHYSLLDGLSRPSQIASRCSELGHASCALTDHGTISGAVAFTQAMKDKNIKPILGCEFYLSQESATIKSPENRGLSHLCVLAKNKKGCSLSYKGAALFNFIRKILLPRRLTARI